MKLDEIRLYQFHVQLLLRYHPIGLMSGFACMTSEHFDTCNAFFLFLQYSMTCRMSKGFDHVCALYKHVLNYQIAAFVFQLLF